MTQMEQQSAKLTKKERQMLELRKAVLEECRQEFMDGELDPCFDCKGYSYCHNIDFDNPELCTRMEKCAKRKYERLYALGYRPSE